MSSFVRISTSASLKELPQNKTIRVSPDCFAVLIADTNFTFKVIFKEGIMPDYFYKNEFIAYIDQNKQASMGLTG
jgi:hypothetical protein